VGQSVASAWIASTTLPDPVVSPDHRVAVMLAAALIRQSTGDPRGAQTRLADHDRLAKPLP
jgi:hypothetical protein